MHNVTIIDGSVVRCGDSDGHGASNDKELKIHHQFGELS